MMGAKRVNPRIEGRYRFVSNKGPYLDLVSDSDPNVMLGIADHSGALKRERAAIARAMRTHPGAMVTIEVVDFEGNPVDIGEAR